MRENNYWHRKYSFGFNIFIWSKYKHFNCICLQIGKEHVRTSTEKQVRNYQQWSYRNKEGMNLNIYYIYKQDIGRRKACFRKLKSPLNIFKENLVCVYLASHLCMVVFFIKWEIKLSFTFFLKQINSQFLKIA